MLLLNISQETTKFVYAHARGRVESTYEPKYEQTVAKKLLQLPSQFVGKYTDTITHRDHYKRYEVDHKPAKHKPIGPL